MLFHVLSKKSDTVEGINRKAFRVCVLRIMITMTPEKTPRQSLSTERDERLCVENDRLTDSVCVAAEMSAAESLI